MKTLRFGALTMPSVYYFWSIFWPWHMSDQIHFRQISQMCKVPNSLRYYAHTHTNTYKEDIYQQNQGPKHPKAHRQFRPASVARMAPKRHAIPLERWTPPGARVSRGFPGTHGVVFSRMWLLLLSSTWVKQFQKPPICWWFIQPI